METPVRQGSTGRKRSEGQARLGAIFVWVSMGILILSLMVFFAFAIADSGAGLKEDDFHESGTDEWTADIVVSDLGTISGSIRSHEGAVKVVVTIYDGYGDEYERYDQSTPVTISIQVFDAGTYEIVVEIKDDGKTIDDLDISISTSGFDMLFFCFGILFFGMLFTGAFVTGFILLLVSIFTRRRELYPSRQVIGYRPPPPPPTYYGVGHHQQPFYQNSFDPYFHGYQNEGNLGYDGPPRVVRQGYVEDDQEVGPW